VIVIQNSVNFEGLNEAKLSSILQSILDDFDTSESELLLRFVDTDEIIQLNKTYRHQDKPTNVLSFPSDLPVEINEAILGDAVICVEVVKKEAKTQGKIFEHHLLHIAIHATLHLLGFDHIKPAEAEIMEALEVKILNQNSVNNPYE
jgi:probable rRNA maturation factor